MTTAKRKVSLFRNGRSQAIRIPKEFELPGKEATIRKDGDVLVIEALPKKMTLIEVLDSLDPIGEDFPEIEDFPPEPVEI
jgi:antitoxin VapB